MISMTSLGIIEYVTFIGDASRGLLFPALWPLTVTFGGNKMHQGYVIVKNNNIF